MQQKKIITAVLLLAVIGIWGYVGYTVFNGMNTDEENLTDANILIHNEAPININSKQNLLLNYPDPFLKTNHTPMLINKNTQVHAKKTEKKTPPVLPQITNTYTWPVIVYKGLMKNQNRPEKLLGLIIINGKESIVRKGEKVDELVVISIDKTSVELQHEKEKRSFIK